MAYIDHNIDLDSSTDAQAGESGRGPIASKPTRQAEPSGAAS
jgi:hypothetical protein